MLNRPSGTSLKNITLLAMSTEERDLSHMIADYCNNRLAGGERSAFERLLAEDRTLQDECNEFQGFQRLYRKLDASEPAPSQAIFAQVAANIGAGKGKVGQRVPRGRGLSVYLAQTWRRLQESITIPWALAAVQAVALVLLLIPATQQTTYSTLSASQAAIGSGRPAINVVFRPTASEQEIRDLLRQINASLSDGPSREGRYVLTIGSEVGGEKALRTLQGSGVVLFAETVK